MDTRFAALAAFALLLIACLLRWRRGDGPPALLCALAGMLAAALAIDGAIGAPGGLRLGLGEVLALYAWLVVAVQMPLRQRLHLAPLDLVVWGAAALLIALGLLWPQAAATGVTELSGALRLHILLSLLAWAVLTLATAQAAAGTWLAHRLRAHREPRITVPLIALERSAFRLIAAGWVLLLGGIATGFLFVEDFLAQHLVHKAAFTIMAAVLFGTLLVGQTLRGWRGDRALRWVLGAWVVLFIGYAGVKFILEYGLARSWT